jgi:hypothetical protein
MNFVKKYWWIFILVFFLFSFKKKEEEDEDDVQFVKIGDNNKTVLKLQDWLINNGWNIKRDSKYGTQTGDALNWALFEDQDKFYDGKDKYFKVVSSPTKVWVEWIDLHWLSKEYGFN